MAKTLGRKPRVRKHGARKTRNNRRIRNTKRKNLRRRKLRAHHNKTRKNKRKKIRRIYNKHKTRRVKGGGFSSSGGSQPRPHSSWSNTKQYLRKGLNHLNPKNSNERSDARFLDAVLPYEMGRKYLTAKTARGQYAELHRRKDAREKRSELLEI
jgi:hypothetical protein